MDVICLFGAPACGKGTEADLLAAEGYTTFSPGAYIRQKAAEGVQIYQDFLKATSKGELVANDGLIIDSIKAKIAEVHAAGGKGIVLDGFPRKINQALALDDFLKDLGLRPTVIELQVNPAQLEQRRQSRIAQALAAGQPPRADDDKATFDHRQAVYRRDTMPLLAHYAAQRNLVTIEAYGAPIEVHGQVKRFLTPSAPGFPPAGPRC